MIKSLKLCGEWTRKKQGKETRDHLGGRGKDDSGLDGRELQPGAAEMCTDSKNIKRHNGCAFIIG